MAEKTGTIHIKWVRSGIGFPRRQKETVKSLGLRRLNQVVERPDTAHIRGLVAKVPHLVEIVDPSESPAWSSLPEYTIIAAEARPVSKPRAKRATKEAAVETSAAGEEAEAAEAAPQKKTAAKTRKSAAAETAVAAPRKRTPATKSRSSESAKKAAAEPEKPKLRRKAAKPEPKAKK